MTTQLSPSQHAILAHAIHHTNGQIDWFPDNIKGGARKKVVDAMFSRTLIINDGTHWIVAAEGYDALGMARPQPQEPVTTPTAPAAPEIEAAVTDVETKAPRTRDNSKQATVIGMLRRPEGATIQQIIESTGWQAHTVRGTFAGAFKKKLGLAITSTKDAGEQRVYRIG